MMVIVWKKARHGRRLFLLTQFMLFSCLLIADEYHYKNVLVGDRAATMGGAYVAISDDSSGTYYNPAGIAFAYGDSVSGSGNAFHSSTTTYKEAIGTSDWVRDSSTVLPNFFGMIKKFGPATVAISYIVPDTIIEHQDQKYDVNNAQVSTYHISLHSEDKTNLIGSSIAYKFDDSLSIGFGLFYSYRIYRHEQAQFLVLSNSSAEASYSSVKIEEVSYLAKFGLQLSLFDPVFFGLTISQSMLDSRTVSSDSYSIISLDYGMTNKRYSEDKKYPLQLSIGMAIYPSPSFLFSTDIDYYMVSDDNLETIMNVSVGSEWFMNANNALRFGLFTNNDNRQPCTSTSCTEAKIDINGISFGYSSYTRSSSFTLGAVYTMGSGKADIYGNQSVIVDVESRALTVIFAASYDY